MPAREITIAIIAALKTKWVNLSVEGFDADEAFPIIAEHVNRAYTEAADIAYDADTHIDAQENIWAQKVELEAK